MLNHGQHPPKEGSSGYLSDCSDRRIGYLRVSVTDRCNLRCSYCMPPSGIVLKRKEEVLSFEELTRLIDILLPMGISKIRITGGEPLLRRGIGGFIAGVKKRAPALELCMTTNGVLLADHVETLKRAGLDRVNVSLDTLRPEKFKALTGSDHLERVLEGIETLIACEMFPVKVNVLLLPGFNEDETEDFLEFARRMPVELRFIEKMPIGEHNGNGFLSVSSIEKILKIRFGAKEGMRKAGETARVHSVRGFKGKIGLISPLSSSFCGDCNRLRITADGKLISCLLGGTEEEVKSALRGGAVDGEIRAIARKVLSTKPAGHMYHRYSGEGYLKRCMATIGG
ncbi:MAG: GTP 3',8-cyclase MoaA [Deltaproteobacteria bacterium]|nr:GTP 3',8-cyclase MoaA [Deltaproteobacteria bacterium]NIS78074.1 GTP 3',8-cyclase MoaA [Deltaproteobacteria bacterium]